MVLLIFCDLAQRLSMPIRLPPKTLSLPMMLPVSRDKVRNVDVEKSECGRNRPPRQCLKFWRRFSTSVWRECRDLRSTVLGRQPDRHAFKLSSWSRSSTFSRKPLPVFRLRISPISTLSLMPPVTNNKQNMVAWRHRISSCWKRMVSQPPRLKRVYTDYALEDPTLEVLIGEMALSIMGRKNVDR